MVVLGSGRHHGQSCLELRSLLFSRGAATENDRVTCKKNDGPEPCFPALLDRQRAKDCLRVILIWIAPAALLRPFQDVPFVDDWVYAWPVQRILEHGDLRLLDYSGSLNFVQVLWGAIFCLPFGFSFSALRLSTWMCAALCLCGTYLLLLELRVSRRDSLIATAVLGAYPIFFMLSYTFMTDVPFLTAMVWSLLAFVRALRWQHDGWLLGGGCYSPPCPWAYALSASYCRQR
jgi:hypothetical protein